MSSYAAILGDILAHWPAPRKTALVDPRPLLIPDRDIDDLTLKEKPSRKMLKGSRLMKKFLLERQHLDLPFPRRIKLLTAFEMSLEPVYTCPALHRVREK